jgi:hypothetical protein
MTDHLAVRVERGIAGHTTLGFHPRDGHPVACWIVHPTAHGPGARARLDRFTAALGLAPHTAAALTEVAPYRASVTAAGGWATLWVEDETEVVSPHDERWLAALLARGWAMVVVGYSTRLAEADNSTIEGYLTSGRTAHVGVVRVP